MACYVTMKIWLTAYQKCQKFQNTRDCVIMESTLIRSTTFGFNADPNCTMIRVTIGLRQRKDILAKNNLQSGQKSLFVATTQVLVNGGGQLLSSLGILILQFGSVKLLSSQVYPHYLTASCCRPCGVVVGEPASK